MRVLTTILDALVFVLAILLLCPQLLAETDAAAVAKE
jgi:hypothetical protein